MEGQGLQGLYVQWSLTFKIKVFPFHPPYSNIMGNRLSCFIIHRRRRYGVWPRYLGRKGSKESQQRGAQQGVIMGVLCMIRRESVRKQAESFYRYQCSVTRMPEYQREMHVWAAVIPKIARKPECGGNNSRPSCREWKIEEWGLRVQVVR